MTPGSKRRALLQQQAQRIVSREGIGHDEPSAQGACTAIDASKAMKQDLKFFFFGSYFCGPVPKLATKFFPVTQKLESILLVLLAVFARDLEGPVIQVITKMPHSMVPEGEWPILWTATRRHLVATEGHYHIDSYTKLGVDVLERAGRLQTAQQHMLPCMMAIDSCRCNRNLPSAVRVLLLCLEVAILQPELRERSARTTLVLQNCAFRAGAARMYSAYYFCTSKFRFSSRSCGNVLRILLLYLKIAIFEPELRDRTPRATFVLNSCDFEARAAEITPRSTFVRISCDFRAGPAESTQHTTFVFQHCDFRAGAAGTRSAFLHLTVVILQPGCRNAFRLLLYLKVSILQLESCRGPGRDRTRDRKTPRAGTQTTRQLPKTSWRAAKFPRRHSESGATFVLKSFDFEARAAGTYSAYYLARISCDFRAGAAESTQHTTFVVQSCDFRAGAAGTYSAYYFCTSKLQLSSRSCGNVLRVLRLRSKVVLLQPGCRNAFRLLLLYL